MTISLQRISSGVAKAAFTLALSMAAFNASADTMYVSHGVKTSDPVYPYTGFATKDDVKGMQVAVKLTNEMLAPLAGSKITAIHIGWAGIYQGSTPEATAFLRPNLNAADITTGVVKLSGDDGWNAAELDEPYTIKENDEIFMGYVVDAEAGVYGPCTLTWGSFAPDTHFLGNPEFRDADGNIEWEDLSLPGMMEMYCPLMLVAEVTVEGEGMQNRMLISQLATPSMLSQGMPATAAIQIQNTGSNDVESIKVCCVQEGSDTWSYPISLSSPIAPNSSAYVAIPVYAESTGVTTVSISDVNGVANGEEGGCKFAPIVVPQATSGRYVRRPLMEYFASESVYQSAAYDEGIVTPAFSEYAGRISRINWHSTDQFQIGLADDRDEAISLLLDVADNDSSKIYLPTLMLDRDMNLSVEPRILFSLFRNPMLGVLYSPFAEYSYEYALDQPTFAGLQVKASVDNDVVTLTVEGDADLSVLPAGEELRLTVVLVEDGIESDSQEFPGGNGDGSNPGHVVHDCVARQLLTDRWGDPIEFKDGKFSMSFATELDYDNVVANMRAVAFINRPKTNSMWERSIINSAECGLVTTGVSSISSDIASLRPMVNGSSIIAPEGASMAVYTASGMSVAPDHLSAGIYLVKVKANNGSSATFKVVVK
ncbi:MAG: Omp28-related outer membrane protein [Muribaculaceae bacterium]|nr:Omp28-related outer membrane protein [Muribaculaceae bacterium]